MAKSNLRSRPLLWLGFGACLCLSAPAGAQAARTEDVQSIAALVNDDVISDYDLQQRINLFARATNNVNPAPEAAERLRQEALKSLVDERLELQEAKRKGVKVSDKDVQRGMDELAQHNRMTYDQMRDYFASAGVDIETLRSQVRAQLTWNHLIAHQFLPRINVSDEEVTSALQEMKRNANRPQRHIAEIVLHVDTPDQEAQVRQTAEDLVSRIREGASFPAVAHQYSQSASAAAGGDVGWVAAGQLSPPIEAALQTMSPGQVSDPIRLDNTYTIVGFLDQRGGTPTEPAAGAQYQLRQLVIPVGADSGMTREAAMARAQDLQRTLKSCADMASAPEAANPLSGDLGTIADKDLPANFRDVLAGLNAGDVARPFVSSDGVHVLMVCGKDAPKTAEPTRDAVEERLTEEQLDRMARRYLRDLRRDAMIEYRVAEH